MGVLMIDRRKLLKGAAVTGTIAAVPVVNVTGNQGAKRKFTIDLTPGAIGVKVKPGGNHRVREKPGF